YRNGTLVWGTEPGGAVTPTPTPTATATPTARGTATATARTTATPTPTTGTATVWRVNTAGRITKNGVVYPIRAGSWFGLEGRHEPSNAATDPREAPRGQHHRTT